ncbi:crossover junction endodeoxyribonuclease RuvC [Candidatus Parcubacteria bacterium]|nr:crossover junction endodeoxyribonuclease RuvC [Patescibacteria group bacterium]MBU4466872.1 crossover junction endodeoxyribonuclease RuvC [Patescibacteria group bacterium]MCG2688110.1 crossover junction endodeoxyribonuclease RuvC [Candidatus Parcubacteria bacterium]
MVILGIDPGTATIGYGVVKAQLSKGKKQKIECLAYGLIETTPDHSFPDRLKKISREYNGLINKYQPDLIAIESVFFFRNLKTFIPVSRACGVLILGAAKKNIPIIELTPLQVKSKVAGYGRAEKKDLQKKVEEILNLEKIPKPDDIADALAVAICAVFSKGNGQRSKS